MKAHIASLQGQVDNLHAGLVGLRGRQDSYAAIDPAFPHDAVQALSVSAALSRTLPPSGSPTAPRKGIPQFHGPTSSAYNFDVAKSSLHDIGIAQEPAVDESMDIEEAMRASIPLERDRDGVHLAKDPIWGISKAEAIRLANVYEEGCGLLYPLFDIDYVISHIKLLWSFIEAAKRSSVSQVHLPGAVTIDDDDTNIAKIVLAIGLVLEGHGQGNVGTAIYESMGSIVSDKILRRTDIKGLCLIALTVSKFSRRSNFVGEGRLTWSQGTYLFHCYEEVRAWRLIGVAARLCFEMGLHRRNSLLKNFTNEVEYLNAVRVFWCIYALDRRWSFGTGLPFALQDTDIDPLLPEPVRVRSREVLHGEPRD